MADIHSLHDSWFEVWYDSGDVRRHMKFHDEAELATEVQNLRNEEASRAEVEKREPADLNFEVTKISVNRETLDVPQAAAPTANGESSETAEPVHATVNVPRVQAAVRKPNS